MQRGSTGSPTCLECRRKRPGYKGKSPVPAETFELTCVVCGKVTPVKWKSYKTCGSEECRRRVRNARKRRYVERTPDALIRGSCQVWHVNCAECGRLFVARQPNQVRCGDKCRKRHLSRITTEAIKRRYREDPEFRDRMISKAQNRHARKLGVGMITSPATLVAYLMKRDHGRCRVPDCKYRDRRIRAKSGPGRPSIDHIVPLSRGGTHELANLQIAHYVCNLSKHNGGGGEQLALVG